MPCLSAAALYGDLDIYMPMPKLIVTLPSDVEERLRLVAHKKGDISAFVTEAVRYRLAMYDKEQLKRLRAMKEKVVSFYDERKFERLVMARGHFTPDGADIQLSIDETRSDQLFDRLLEEKRRENDREHWFVGEDTLIEMAKRELHERIRYAKDKVSEWGNSELEQRHWNSDRVTITFDPETNLRLCPACQFPAEEFNPCLNCGSTC